MRQNKLLHIIMVTAMGLLVSLMMAGCDDDSGSKKTSILYYGGSDPKGDYIVIQIDKTHSQVRRINYTLDSTDPDYDTGWLDYVPETGTEFSSGFTILNRVTLDSGDFVLFAEFPGAACVYQFFDGTTDEPDGNPVYVVSRESVDTASYYDRAFNWMKFKIDATPAESDMECGFAAFDQTSANGLMYGAGYSNRRDLNDADSGCGVSGINTGGAVSVDEFTYDAESVANIMWTDPVNHPNDRDYAISLTGTASGTVILDFGLEADGGMGLAFPQTSDGEFDTAYAGTYFTMVYEYDSTETDPRVQPMKIVIVDDSLDGVVRAFQYDDSTANAADAVFNSTLTPLKDFAEGPNGEPISDTFASYSGNADADSATVNDANNCYGAFLASSGNSVVNTLFDSQGRFLAFTMFDNNGDEYIIRFGFGIKDENYANP